MRALVRPMPVPQHVSVLLVIRLTDQACRLLHATSSVTIRQCGQRVLCTALCRNPDGVSLLVCLVSMQS